MIALLLILAAVVALLSAASLVVALRRAEEGYQDETGFHHGSMGAPTRPSRSKRKVRTSEKTEAPAGGLVLAR